MVPMIISFSLVFASRDPHAGRVVADLSSEIGYLFLVDENYAVPHCVEKFRHESIQVKSFAQMESVCVFSFGPLFLIHSIS